MMIEAVRTFETSVCFNETTRRYIPGGYYLHTRHRENLKCHVIYLLVFNFGVHFSTGFLSDPVRAGAAEFIEGEYSVSLHCA
jgi:hypothetical protein